MAISDADADRRSYERVSWDCHARLVQLGSDAHGGVPGMHAVLGRNISEGGLQVWADRMFAVRSRLLVEMEAPEIPEGIQAVGSVVWVSPSTGEECWLLGIEFSDVGDTALARIRSLVQPTGEWN
ncbi:MAG: PilZ domain-containing protein [Thiocapsa sp.]|uniref:PilZ domain-containing protein n=1 Tax=Thiocapsa sp. TaxID=2024551 RepID=UPI001BD10684|nr:PilZ domain-containing protein [Thiocapsa sp.]QVL48840.1 MAG: PilZ domain-containing protein [Thiocapsa sp.]